MTANRSLGVLGGTFDPIHFGHLDAAAAAQAALRLDEVLLIPAHDPPHRPRDPRASVFHRFALVALALDGRTPLKASDVEVARAGPSYTVDTLRALHADGWPPSQLFFILGADAFAEIATWHEYPAVLDAAHFVVIARPGATLDPSVARMPELRSRIRRASDARPPSPGTGIVLVEAHTRDVSSTTIRARLGAHLPIDDLVPAAVARHIATHDLYGARQEATSDTER
jgi:nicotinate-nucleotide adenylyltransferase